MKLKGLKDIKTYIDKMTATFASEGEKWMYLGLILSEVCNKLWQKKSSSTKKKARTK